ncbi:MAG: TIGR03790 family protein [Acidobacteriota bacterium]|nr:TIGR03790 family protein [Acidobacteriota bacterium]
MKSPKIVPIFFVLFVQFVQFVAAQENVLVVVNENSPDSVAIGHYYAAKRSIPNIVRLRTTASDTISRDTFTREILQPLAAHLRRHDLQDRIHYIVTTRGIPMTIEPGQTAVDSALTLLYHYMVTGQFPQSGRIENPYFAVNGTARPFTRKDFDIYLVTRLTSIDLVDRGILTDDGGDFYFDLASPQDSTESEWIDEAAEALAKAGHKATVDKTAKTLDAMVSVQGYVNQQAVDAPLIRWQSGAIATVLDKDAARAAASYVESGVTGFGSFVADPMSDGWFRPQILFPAYAAGLNLAESFYASSRYLGWRAVVIGDPLAAPYAKAPAAKEPAADHFTRRRASYLMQKYSTSREAVDLLLKAEAAEAKDDRATAASLAGKVLELDSLLTEAADLKSRLTPKDPKAPEAPVAETAAVPVSEPAAIEEAPPEPEAENFPARIVTQTKIEYPPDAKAAKIEGDVLVRLIIDEAGQVMKAEVLRGDPRLAKSVVEATRLWRFDPELQNGRPVIGTYTVPISFKIKN